MERINRDNYLSINEKGDLKGNIFYCVRQFLLFSIKSFTNTHEVDKKGWSYRKQLTSELNDRGILQLGKAQKANEDKGSFPFIFLMFPNTYVYIFIV